MYFRIKYLGFFTKNMGKYWDYFCGAWLHIPVTVKRQADDQNLFLKKSVIFSVILAFKLWLQNVDTF